MTQPGNRPPSATRKAPRIDIESIQVAPSTEIRAANELGWSGPTAVSAAELKAKKPPRKMALAAIWLLIAVGLLNIGLGGYFWSETERTIRRAFAGEVDNRQWQNMLNSYVGLMFSIQIGAGVIMIGLGAAATRAPLMSAILGLLLFILMIATFGAIEPESLLMGIIWKILMVVALIAAVVSANSFESKRKQKSSEVEAAR